MAIVFSSPVTIHNGGFYMLGRSLCVVLRMVGGQLLKANFGKLGGCFELIHEHFLPIIEG